MGGGWDEEEKRGWGVAGVKRRKGDGGWLG